MWGLSIDEKWKVAHLAGCVRSSSFAFLNSFAACWGSFAFEADREWRDGGV
jgi:hypothetical protein